MTIRLRGVEVNYEIDGPLPGAGRPTLILIHGFGASLRTWDRIAPALARTHPLLRVDLKGFGLSGHPRDGRYSIEENADIVTDLVIHQRLARIVLVAHSYGGAVACLTNVKLRERQGPRVDALVLIDSASYAQRLPFFISGLRNPIVRWLSPFMGTPESKSRIVLRSLFVDKSLVDDAMVERYAFPMRVAGSAYSSAQTAMQILPASFDDVTRKIRSIDVPTQIIWGDRDTAAPFAFADRLHRDIPGSRLAVMRNVGHMPHEERPDEVLRVLAGFLESLPAGKDAAVDTHLA